MHDRLIKKLGKYISDNNPEIFAELNDVSLMAEYVEAKVKLVETVWKQLEEDHTPAYITEEICMDKLTNDLRPSKYNYILNLLDENFEFAYQQWQKSGVLLYEAINIISECEETFKAFGFSEDNEDNRQLRHAITGIIDKYLGSKK